MRRAVWAIASGLLVVSLALAQEGSAGAAAEAGDPLVFWKWINFAILVAGLGYLIGKAAPAYFQARRDEIQKALIDAAREIQDAEAKAADLDSRFSGIQKEAEQLRQEAKAMMAAEAERIRQETERHLTRIQEQTTQEIVLMSRVARDDLRKYSAGLALDLAEQRIRTRVNAEAESGLVDDFLADLRSRARAN
jgi:F0F1-type ATP synthase membrane subunit b/b'